LAEFLTFSLNTEERIRSSNSPGSIDFIDNPPNHLIHLLATKDIIYEEFRKQFKKAFNNHIILNHRAGSILPLHIGKRVPILEGEDRVSSTYIERLNKLPRIETQGDGMRSFTGILLTLLCTPQQILFIDEPEAFLHPPQARLLGEIIGKNEQGRQIFIATHSIDFILGLLNSDGDTSIIRVEREGDLNPTVDINEEKIKTIWQDPLLRYSNILDGLFYNQVVICESESDSMFYQAMISEEDSSRSVFFTNANGKGQMKKIIDAFKLTGIQIDIIVDIDILMNNETLKKIYESLGGQWEEISSKYNQIKTFLDAKTVAPSRESICELLSPIITSDEKNIKEEDKRILKQAVEKTKNTKVLKTLGIRIFNEDSVINQVFLDLNQKFREKGLHIVPVGELEGFDTEISGHGPKWAIKAIDKFSNGENYQEAKNFILSIINP
jgi:arsenate reductase-like glutaredoxin family protein